MLLAHLCKPHATTHALYSIPCCWSCRRHVTRIEQRSLTSSGWGIGRSQAPDGYQEPSLHTLLLQLERALGQWAPTISEWLLDDIEVRQRRPTSLTRANESRPLDCQCD